MIKYKILVLYYIPLSSNKSKLWWDGFVAGINLLQGFFEITAYNIAYGDLLNDYINSFDFILVKSNWKWVVDSYIRKYKLKRNVKKGIVISGSNPLPSKKDIKYYDVLFYQTIWYGQYLKGHKLKVQAYGIDDSIMKPIKGLKKEYDWLSIGSIKDYKRFDKLIEKTGKKVIVGDNIETPISLLNFFKKNDILVKEFVSYKDLAYLINQSKAVYIPSTVHGGGERAVWEAIACNVPVYIEDDNPKLLEIINAPLMNHMHYSNQILYGILLSLKIPISPNWMVNIPNTSIGLFNFQNGGLIIEGVGKLKVGSYCTFEKNIKIIFNKRRNSTHVAHINPISRILNISRDNYDVSNDDQCNNIKIGNDVFIGENTCLFGNIEIEDGCYIAPNSVVITNLPSYSICEGNPAKIIGFRFNKEIIDTLINIGWWNWSVEKILNNKEFFQSDLTKLTKQEIIEIIKDHEINIFQR